MGWGLLRVVVVGVGSNLGGREAALRCAGALLDARDGIEVRDLSAIYETEPLGPPQPRYLNAAFRLQTALSPPELLHVLLRTERRLGRHRVPDERWGPRSVDLDLLWDERGPYESPVLRVPHPELVNRSFALAPLLDVAPELDEAFGPSLLALGDRPRAWGREATVHTKSSPTGFAVDVEADSLADACALCVGHTAPPGRPWSTHHVSIKPGPDEFADLLRDRLRNGFAAQRATISHCSQSQWGVELHGVNMGIPLDANVRLRTTSGAKRNVHAQLSIALTRT